MNIVSKFKDFYDFNTIYDSDKTIEFRREPFYIQTEDNFKKFYEDLRARDRRSSNIIERCRKWTFHYYSKPMEGPEYEMRFEYRVIGIYPYVYLIPIVVVGKRNIRINNCMSSNFEEVEVFNDITLPFNSEALSEIGKKYNMKFRQFKGKGKNKQPIHRVILRKFMDIETSFFYLEEYISPDDIVIDSPENLRSPEYRDLFHSIGTPIFYMGNSIPKHQVGVDNSWRSAYWNFVINPDFSEIDKISLQVFAEDTSIYSRIEQFLIEQKIVPIPEPSNEVKIESAGFDKKISFRKDKQQSKKRK